jgi:four helix bundle protein
LSDYLRFLTIAYGSVRELQYQASLAERLGFLKQESELLGLSIETAKVLNGLIRSLKAKVAETSD